MNHKALLGRDFDFSVSKFLQFSEDEARIKKKENGTINESLHRNSELKALDQRCPTHSPFATCGEWPFKCGE